MPACWPMAPTTSLTTSPPRPNRCSWTPPGGWTPPGLRQVVAHLREVIDPDTTSQAERRHARRGLWLAPTLEGMVALDGLLEPEAGQTLLAALEPLARPASAADDRTGGQRRADALAELARRQLEGGRLPQTGGVRPQLMVLVDLDSLQGGPGSLGGDTELGPLSAETCQRLACDGAVTRVLVTRQATSHHGHHDDPCGDHHPRRPESQATLTDRLQAAARRLPPVLGGAPSQPWTSAGPPGSSNPPNGPPWPCGTAAVSSPAVIVPLPGVRPIIWSTGWMAARPTWPTWSWCAEPIIGRSMRAAGNSSPGPTGG